MTTLGAQADLGLIQLENLVTSKVPSNGSSDKNQSWLMVESYGVSDLSQNVLTARPNPTLGNTDSNLLERAAHHQGKEDELNTISAISEHNGGRDLEDDIMWNSAETTLLLDYIDRNYASWHSGNKTSFYKRLTSEVLKNRNTTQVKNKVHKLLAKFHKLRSQKNSGGHWQWYSRMDQVFGQRGHTPSTVLNSDPKSINVESSDDSEENKQRPIKKKRRTGTSSSNQSNTTASIGGGSSITASSADWLEKFWEDKLTMQQREMEMQIALQKEKMEQEYRLQKEKLEIEKINAENVKTKLEIELEQIKVMKMQFEMKIKELDLKLHQQQQNQRVPGV